MSWLVWDCEITVISVWRLCVDYIVWCLFCTLWLDHTSTMKLNVLIWELWLTDGGCIGAVGVWFGECGAGVMLICVSRETGSCLPVCHASICVSQFTPSLPISAAALGHSMGFNMASTGPGTTSENTHTNANHLLRHISIIMSCTSSVPIDSRTYAGQIQHEVHTCKLTFVCSIKIMWTEELILIKKPNTQAGSECEYNRHTRDYEIIGFPIMCWK